MQAFRLLMTTLNRKKQRKRACRLLYALADAEMKKLTALTAGMSDSERLATLKADGGLTATILSAYPHQDADVAAAVSAGFQVLEKMRTAEAAQLGQINQQFAAHTAHLRSVLNAYQVPDNQGTTQSKPEARVNFDKIKNQADDLLRRARSFLGRSMGMGLTGLLLFAGDLALLYDNFEKEINAKGSGDLTALLSAVVSTLLVALLLLLLTHLGAAPLFRRVCKMIQSEEEKTTPEVGVPARKNGWPVLIIMLVSMLLTFVVSGFIAVMREDQVISEGSGMSFVILNILGLPVLSLFIHLCFTGSFLHWKSYREMKDHCLDTVMQLQAADSTLARNETQKRIAQPTECELRRIGQVYQNQVQAAYERVVRHPSLRSEIDRMAELLVAPAPNTRISGNDSDNPSPVSPGSDQDGATGNDSSVLHSDPQSPVTSNGKKTNKSLIISLLILICLSHGCGPKHTPHHMAALMDDTEDCVNAPGAEAAWHDGFNRLKRMVPDMLVGGEVDVYTMADTHDYTPRPVVTWTKDMNDGKAILSARSRKRHLQELEAQLDGLFSTARAHPVTVQTRMVETIYEIIRTMHDQDGSCPDDVLVITSDMEPYTDELTASRIIRSDESLKRWISQVVKTHPSLGADAPRIVIVYKPSSDLLKANPDCIGRLKTFWLAFFHAIGCKQVDWVSPQPETTPGKTAQIASGTIRSRL